MNQTRTTWATLAASIFVGGVVAANTQGQSSDALLNTLLKKGVITEQEAKDIKAEASKENQQQFNQAFSAKTGMPSWVNSYKLYGDFRGRYEGDRSENSVYLDRDRYRFRLRLGLNISMMDNFDVGFRLATGNPQFNNGGFLVGGQSITANQDLNSLDSRKFLWIDAAYAKWTPIKNKDWTVTGIIGKMDNPFQLSNMIWDYDIAPEGAAIQVVYNINDQHALKANSGIFVLDEFNQENPSGGSTPAAPVKPTHDPYMFGSQLLFESKWTPKIDTSLGVAAFNIVHQESLSGLVQPFYNAGNSRDLNGYLLHHYDPIIGSAWATYKVDTGPSVQLPIKVGGEYMHNPSAPSDRNTGYRAGITVGKAGRKNTWEVNYRYQRLEADAWYDALVDDDNRSFFASGVAYSPGQTPLLFRGLGPPRKDNGLFGGTNVKGHQIVATYSFTDFANLSFIYYNNEGIITSSLAGVDTKSGASHFMVDLNWKF